jgi:cation transport ATPase
MDSSTHRCLGTKAGACGTVSSDDWEAKGGIVVEVGGVTMSLQTVAGGFLRAVGLLLVVLGLVHSAATPHMAQLLGDSSSEVYRRALGPMLLNHVLMGILLLPLGYTTWLAADAQNRNAAWARRVLVVNGIVLLTFPVSIAVFMRRPEYYRAPFFLTGVILVMIISLSTIVAAWLVGRSSSLRSASREIS